MTGQTGSQFAAKADAAAAALKEQLGLQSKKVPVGEDGQPLRPLPPVGSYLRNAIEAQRAEMAAQAPSAINGQAASATNGNASEPSEEELLSANAARRFSELTGQLRERERNLIELAQRGHDQDRELAQLRGDLEAMRRQHEELQAERQQILDQTLEGLDPETRATVLMESKLKRLLEEHERKVAARFESQLKRLSEKSELDDFDRLSRKYQRFDQALHRPLIEMFRGKNPAASVEQAFKAIAEPSELVLREEALASTVPPVLGPGSGPTAEHMVPKPQPDPVARMVEDARQVKELLRSRDPEERKIGMKLQLQNIKDRLDM